MNKLQLEINDVSGSVKFNGQNVPGVKGFTVSAVAQDASMVTLEIYVKDCDLRYASQPETVEVSDD